MTEPQVHLRRAQQGDLSAIEKLLVASELPSAGVADSLHGFIVAAAHQQLVGVIGVEYCSNRCGLLRSTAVVSSMRHCGIGRLLVNRDRNLNPGCARMARRFTRRHQPACQPACGANGVGRLSVACRSPAGARRVAPQARKGGTMSPAWT